MPGNYIFSLEPTFTQGLILGQLSVVVLIGLILKYIFLESTTQGLLEYQTRSDGRFKLIPQNLHLSDIQNSLNCDEYESTEWFNTLFCQVLDVYRSKLRDDLSGPEGDEVARKKVEEYVNRIRPAGFLDCIKIHSIDLGSLAPRLCNARTDRPQSEPLAKISLDMTYTDTISVSLSTSYLFNYPTMSFARLPVSLTIALSQFKSSITATPLSPDSPAPALILSISPDFVLDLTTTSLMGSRAKLANVPKLHQLIQHQLRKILAARSTWRIVLPGLASAPDVQEQVIKDERLS